MCFLTVNTLQTFSYAKQIFNRLLAALSEPASRLIFSITVSGRIPAEALNAFLTRTGRFRHLSLSVS